MGQTTFVMLKPDALERNLTDLIVKQLENDGIEIVRKRQVTVDQKRILNHYEDVLKRAKNPRFKPFIIKAFVGRDVLVLEVKKKTEDIINYMQQKIGKKDPALANKNTIRGLYGIDSLTKARAENRILKNVIHTASSLEEAQKELTLWFDS